jgi:Flp pilus assembly protein TadG
MKRFNQSTRHGHSLVEFVLLIPAFLLMSVIVFDLGRAVYYSNSIHNAAREAARYGIINPGDEKGIKQKAINYALGLGLQDSDISISRDIPKDNASQLLSQVTVYVGYDFYPVTPLISNLLADTCGGNKCIQLKGDATMRLEAQP